MNDELREGHRFDYREAKPNRFAALIRGTEMIVLDLSSVGIDYEYPWFHQGETRIVKYPHYVDYRVKVGESSLSARIGFGSTADPIHGRTRRRAIVWMDGHATGFLGADDFDATGDMLFGMDMPGSETMCRHPDEIPREYRDLLPEDAFVSYRDRVSFPGVRHSWAVIANIADHRRMILAAYARR